MISHAEAGRVEDLRRRVLERLRERKAADPGFRVIDVGGSYNPWADECVDAYVDLHPAATAKPVFRGDVCDAAVWDEIRSRERRFDFSICTHLLEDVRDPAFVLGNLVSISRAGYVATPTKHSELANVESDYYLGYCHHRWVFTVREVEGVATLVAVAKLPVVGYLNARLRPLLWLMHRVGRWSLAAKAQRRLGIFPAGGGVGWVRRELVGHDTELGVLWEDELPFSFLNADYAGHTCLETADLYRQGLREGE